MGAQRQYRAGKKIQRKDDLFSRRSVQRRDSRPLVAVGLLDRDHDRAVADGHDGGERGKDDDYVAPVHFFQVPLRPPLGRKHVGQADKGLQTRLSSELQEHRQGARLPLFPISEVGPYVVQRMKLENLQQHAQLLVFARTTTFILQHKHYPSQGGRGERHNAQADVEV
uniref:Uncharacterized protein n=1 Tax=Corethron hystrix TaxID=216773 RepID=A0A7S1BFE2_9STRA